MDVGDAEVKDLGHSKAFRGADHSAKAAKATLAHVDIELRGKNPFWCAIRSFSELLYSADWLDRNAVYRTNFCTFVTNNTIVDLIVQSVSTIDGHRDRFVGVLDRGDTVGLQEIIMLIDAPVQTASPCIP